MIINKITVDTALFMANQMGLEGKTIINVAYVLKPPIEGIGYLPALMRVENNDHIYFVLDKDYTTKEKEDNGEHKKDQLYGP